jgi:hypothetical protein
MSDLCVTGFVERAYQGASGYLKKPEVVSYGSFFRPHGLGVPGSTSFSRDPRYNLYNLIENRL